MNWQATIGLSAALALTGCGSFHLDPARPPSASVVAMVTVSYASQLEADKRRMLDRLAVPMLMQQALSQSFTPGPGVALQVMITQFRSGRWGPTRMHVVAQVVDVAGNVVGGAEADATSVMGSSRGALIQAVAQECINQLAARL
jgi:hypothetical protein